MIITNQSAKQGIDSILRRLGPRCGEKLFCLCIQAQLREMPGDAGSQELLEAGESLPLLRHDALFVFHYAIEFKKPHHGWVRVDLTRDMIRRK